MVAPCGFSSWTCAPGRRLGISGAGSEPRYQSLPLDVPVPKWIVTVSPGLTWADDGSEAAALPTRGFQPARFMALLPLLRSITCGSVGSRRAPAKAIGARA